ncbi:hypothetical protein KVT40_000576 [Elsinoe batatas]|uniref:Uncharacterized protein n=1 Tax=Elsinoe batatas TaxID=2601811 RepID=A0A8K0L7K7_9PEZI|nr:hypothetical protein KVT40_000576 [Elsinoe batatas]
MYLSSICALAAALWSTATVAEPVQIRQASGCNAKNKQLIALNANLKDPVLFCMWWRGNTNNKTPFTSLKTSDANSVCKCINANPMLGGSTMVEVTPSNPQIKYLADFQNVILSPLPFCKVWTKSEGRDVAPFTEIAATVVSQLCSSIIKKPSLIAPKPNVTSTSTSAASRQTSSASASMMTSAMPSPTQLILNPLLRGSGSNSSGRNDLVLKTWSNIIGPVAHAQDLGHGTTPLHILSLLTTNENDVIYNSASVSTSYVVPATTTTAWWSASVVYDSWCNLSEGDNSEGCEGQVVVSGSDGNARTADLHITTGGVIEPTRSVNIPFDSSGRFSGGLSIGFKADTATLEEPIVYSIFGG